ncbi:hypothetical protein HY639_00025 [Candidatus Woesearchaeota archaeon]|nr:hypothetical protein [Candidatus Woesearchaeota archaeon]
MNKLELAELIGILLGDGCIGRYVIPAKDKIKMQYRVKITLDSNADKKYAPLLKKMG